MATIAKTDQRGMFLRLLDEAYDHTAWHGPNLKSSVRGVTSVEAVWRPGSGRRNIAEIVLHCAYYKYVVRRRLTGSKRGGFPLRGSDWFEAPNSLAQSLWREYLSILHHEHVELRAALEAACQERALSFHAAEIPFCTDNAVMIAALGYHLHLSGNHAGLDLDAYPTGSLLAQ